METVLEVKDLCVTYQNKSRSVYAVKDVSFSINQGDSLGIVGESGSGKSTLAMAILRLLPPKTAKVTGEAYFQGKELLTLDDASLREIRWKHLAVVFQKAMNALSPVHRISTQIEDIYRQHCFRWWAFPTGCTGSIPTRCPAACSSAWPLPSACSTRPSC